MHAFDGSAHFEDIAVHIDTWDHFNIRMSFISLENPIAEIRWSYTYATSTVRFVILLLLHLNTESKALYFAAMDTL